MHRFEYIVDSGFEYTVDSGLWHPEVLGAHVSVPRRKKKNNKTHTHTHTVHTHERSSATDRSADAVAAACAVQDTLSHLVFVFSRHGHNDSKRSRLLLSSAGSRHANGMHGTHAHSSASVPELYLRGNVRAAHAARWMYVATVVL